MMGSRISADSRKALSSRMPTSPPGSRAGRKSGCARKAIASGKYGKLLGGHFKRIISDPTWLADFYNPRKVGGPVIDLHIHDADFVRWCFGEPDALVSAGSLDHVTTLYHYENGPRHVAAEGGWDHSPGFPFRMRYIVVFERATAEFDQSRDPPLMLSREGVRTPVAIEFGTGIAIEF